MSHYAVQLLFEALIDVVYIQQNRRKNYIWLYALELALLKCVWMYDCRFVSVVHIAFVC